MATPTAQLYVSEGGRIRRFPRRVEYRWKAYEIERRGGGVRSVVRMPEGRPAVIGRLCFERAMRVPRVWRFTDYWNVPPEDVPMLNVVEREGRFVIDDT